MCIRDSHKGDKLYIEGRIHYRTYDDAKGLRHYVTEVYADNMELLTPKSAKETNQSTAISSATNNEDDDAPF